MDNLTLQWQAFTDKNRRQHRRLHVLVNNVSIRTLFADYELSQALSHFGDDFLLEPDVIDYSRDAWWHSCEHPASRIILLCCQCGQVECSAFSAQTVRTDQEVFWQFSGYPRRDYSAFPTFWFSLEQYRAAVTAAFALQ